MSVVTLGRVEFAGFSLLLLGFLAAGYLRAHSLSLGDVLVYARRFRRRAVVAVLRFSLLRRHSGPLGRDACCPESTSAPNPAARAADEPNDDTPGVVGSPVSAAGRPGPVV